jgi:hypothetical protein
MSTVKTIGLATVKTLGMALLGGIALVLRPSPRYREPALAVLFGLNAHHVPSRGPEAHNPPEIASDVKQVRSIPLLPEFERSNRRPNWSGVEILLRLIQRPAEDRSFGFADSRPGRANDPGQEPQRSTSMITRQ